MKKFHYSRLELIIDLQISHVQTRKPMLNLYNKAASVFVCLDVRKINPLPIVQFQIWAQIWNPLAKVDVLRLVRTKSDHKQKIF